MIPPACHGRFLAVEGRFPIAVTIIAMLMKAPDAMTASAATPEDEGVPVSVKIRERIHAARKRFHANDNIA